MVSAVFIPASPPSLIVSCDAAENAYAAPSAKASSPWRTFSTEDPALTPLPARIKRLVPTLLNCAAVDCHARSPVQARSWSCTLTLKPLLMVSGPGSSAAAPPMTRMPAEPCMTVSPVPGLPPSLNTSTP